MRITKRHVGYMLIALSCTMVVAAFAGFYSLLLPAIVPAFLGIGLFGNSHSTNDPASSIVEANHYFDDVSGANGPYAQEWATLGDFPPLTEHAQRDL